MMFVLWKQSLLSKSNLGLLITLKTIFLSTIPHYQKQLSILLGKASWGEDWATFWVQNVCPLNLDNFSDAILLQEPYTPVAFQEWAKRVQMNLPIHDYRGEKLLWPWFFCVNVNINFSGYHINMVFLVASNPNPITRKACLIIEWYHVKVSECK